MLISVYTTTRLGTLVYIARNIKEYKSCPVRDKDNNKDINTNNSKNNKIDINKDKDKDNVKNNKINNKIVKAFLGHLDSMELIKTLCYKDVNLLFLPNLTRTHDLLALEINF
jgi:hypothetical protein